MTGLAPLHKKAHQRACLLSRAQPREGERAGSQLSEERYPQRSNWLAPWPRLSGSQNCENINVCCLSTHSMVLSWQPKLMETEK